MPNVVMNDGTRSPIVIRPMMRPISAEAASAARIANGTGRPKSCMFCIRNGASAKTCPTDRSISRQISSMISPQAMITGAATNCDTVCTLALVIVAIMHIVLRHTRWGLHTVAIGGNIIAAAEAGIAINRIKVGNFVLTSTLGGLTGLLEAFRVGSIDPLAGGSNIMFLGVASGVIGGTAIAGGAGTIIGGLVGGIMLGVLQDGFTLQGINAFTFDIVIGAAILIAMIANIHLARLRGGGPA